MSKLQMILATLSRTSHRGAYRERITFMVASFPTATVAAPATSGSGFFATGEVSS